MPLQRNTTQSGKETGLPSASQRLATVQYPRPQWVTSLARQFSANFLAQVLHPAIVVSVNLAVYFIQIYAALVHDTVFRCGIGNVNGGSMFTQIQRAVALSRADPGHLPAERRAGIHERSFHLRGRRRVCTD